MIRDPLHSGNYASSFARVLWPRLQMGIPQTRSPFLVWLPQCLVAHTVVYNYISIYFLIWKLNEINTHISIHIWLYIYIYIHTVYRDYIIDTHITHIRIWHIHLPMFVWHPADVWQKKCFPTERPFWLRPRSSVRPTASTDQRPDCWRWLP